MRRWNGWGDASIRVELPPEAAVLLQQRVGNGRICPDYPLHQFLKRIPAVRLPQHPLVTDDPLQRLECAHGQSLPDWIRLRGGTLKRFPDGVAQPESVQDLHTILAYAGDHDAVVIPYGGGTSVAGHLSVCESERPVLSVALQRVNRLIDIDGPNLLATFEAGIRGVELERQLNAEGFTLGHFPQSFEYSTLGGWVATRSSGQQSRHYGRIEQLYAGGEVATFRGQLKLPPFPASAAGPDLRQLVLGSEGRMGILTSIIVKILPLPDVNDIHGIFFPSWDYASKAVQALAQSQISLSMIRLSNVQETAANLTLAGHAQQIKWLKRFLRFRGIDPERACMCLVGYIGSARQTRVARSEAAAIIRGFKGVTAGKQIGDAWKKNRFRSAYLRNTLWERGYAVDTLETAVNWDKVTITMNRVEDALMQALEPVNERVLVFSHLSHVYATGASIYTTFVFRLADTPQKTLDHWRKLKQAASQAIVEAGGTISHHHGIGRDHKPYLEAEKGAVGVNTLRQMFAYLDPNRQMNPGKLLP
ncbi:MAG: FAD-binding oxidoreductase [Desulfobacterales bacterium]|jgi:alkyldihydroxyacetonephosphate synthase